MPLIAVTTSWRPAANGRPAQAVLNEAYLSAIQAAGATPLLLTPGMTAADVECLLSLADGVMLTGGGDIEPAAYGAPRHGKTANIVPARDALEFEVSRRALESALPVFAICRGMQVVNVALGGTLHQHIPEAFPASPVRHAQTEHGHGRDERTHEVAVGAGTRLAAITGAGPLAVNSMHHQCVDQSGDGLVPVACAPDGVVEAVELPGREAWFLGVQWHPEELAATVPDAAALFGAFVEACRA